MADFKTILEWLRDGKKIRRKSWSYKDSYIQIKHNHLYHKDKEIPDVLSTIFCDDWELYEEEKLCDHIDENLKLAKGLLLNIEEIIAKLKTRL